MILKIVAAITLVSVPTAFVAALVLGRLFPGVSLTVRFVTLLLITGGVLALAVFERRSPIFGSITWKGPPGSNRIALTFDDGPNEPFTSRIISILKEKQVGATFFVIGRNCEKYPEVLKRLDSEGFEIGNHAWTHEVLPLKTPSRARWEIERTSVFIEKITGKRPALFRAPHGWRNPWTNRAARASGCTPVAWTLGVWDTDRPGAQTIVRRTVDGVRDGCIILLHDGRGTEHQADSSQLVEALPFIIDELKLRGFEFVKLSRLMRAGTP